MIKDTNQPSASNWLKWFDPRGRDAGTWAFVINRISALGLTLYLFIHLIILGKLAQGPEAYNSFLELARHPVTVFGELLVVIAGLYHGLNGIRIALTSFRETSAAQKQIFFLMLAVTIFGGVTFAVRMFSP